jgi:pilus assembly protein CpaB
MNVRRMAILAVAAVAAGAAALLVRSMLGGGTQQVAASLPNVQTSDVLVASADIDPGHPLDASNVRWQPWPKDSLSPALLTKDLHPDATSAISGAVVRTPILAGQPITENNIVRIGQAGFMSAMITPGKRAVSIPISAETGAGGFILPNDHVDVILTRQMSGSGKNFQVETVLRDVRVLAIDQTFKDEKDAQTAVGKTATLELAPDEAEALALARAQGTLSLALRGLTENTDAKLAEEGAAWGHRNGTVAVIRYGVTSSSSSSSAGGPQ